MSGFQEIIGQEHIKEHFQKAIAEKKVSHAYIIQGERFSGKEFIAKIFTRALLCENGNGDTCEECHSCKQALSGNHPDIIYVSHEKPNSIGVEDVRRQINNDIVIKPYSSDYKVYIMNEGEKMTVQAQNAILKTLEEPPAYGVIIILTTSTDALLPTILSRCVVLNMRPVKDEQVKEFLVREMMLPDYKADICVAFARGNIGRAKMLASSEEFDNIRNEALSLVKNIRGMELHEVMKAIKRINEYQMDVNDYLDVLSIWYRDVLLFKATNDVNHLIFKEEIQYIRKAANMSAYEGIEKVLEALDRAKSRLMANVNFDLTMELLFMTIQEN
ncbi:MAG: DNA polymerase III subunit delta [Lachnospiraceae bacterium]|nr:DNA polymerase III subunit delta [Lachnospiraceae bacterium]